MPGCCCIYCTSESTRGIMQNCGQYEGFTKPGLLCIPMWPFKAVIGTISMRVQMVDVAVETKTHDNVFVNIVVSVQYEIIESEIENAFYKLSEPKSQIRSFVFDSVRSIVPKMELDHVFLSKEEVAQGVRNHLADQMRAFGYKIVQTLVTDVSPDRHVKASMNEISASRRLKEASQFKADADKITLVKAAEADAERKLLSGQGVANQRKAICNGLKASVKDFQENVDGTEANDVLSLVMVAQYFDMLESIGSQNSTAMVFTDGASQVRDGVMEANASS